ncbi:hypothetical protein P7C70_g8370, partial [Phenoliferia sp. Uapishka_3]
MSENLVFDSESPVIPGTLSQFKKVLSQFLDWIHDDSTPFAVANFKHDLGVSVEGSRLTPKGQAACLEFWCDTVDAVSALPTQVWEDEDLSTIHPLVAEALLTDGIDYLDDKDVRAQWFTQAGTYRLQRPPSRGPSESGGRSTDQTVTEDDDTDGNDSSTASPPARPVRDFHLDSGTEEEWNGIKDVETDDDARESSPQREATPEDEVETVGSLLKRMGPAKLSSRIGPKDAKRERRDSPARVSAPRASATAVPRSKTVKENISARLSTRSRRSPSPEEAPNGGRRSQRPPPRHQSRSHRTASRSGSPEGSEGYGSDSDSDTFFADVENSLRLPYNNEDLEDLPRHVLKTKKSERRWRQLTKHGKGKESIYSIVQRITAPMDYSDIVKTLYGEHVNLATVYHYSPGSTFDIAPAFEELFASTAVTKKSAIKYAPLTFSQWVLSFDTWAALVVRFYPERTDELRRWKLLVVRKASRATEQTQARIIRWESRCREETSIVGGTYRWLGEADTNGELYIEYVTVHAGKDRAHGRSHSDDDPRPTTTTSAATAISVAAVMANTRNSNAARLLVSMLPLYPLLRTEEESEDILEGIEVLGYLDSDLEPFLALGDSEEIPNQPPAKAKAPPGHALSGVGVAPKLRRKFHWPPPEQDPPKTPLLSSTYTARPLPRPPKAAWDDPLAQAAKRDFPHLFREAPVLNVEGFREGLKDHPNRPWVDSVLWSLQHGCWPCHDGLPPKPPPPEDMRKFPEREADLVIIEKQVNSDIAAGWTSKGYRSLPKGVVLCGLFVVHQADKNRVVNDQTKNGLNDGVDRADAPAVYDGVKDLIRLLRSLDLANLSKDVVLWKLDVSAAFKQMLMHWLWQFRQGVAVSHLLPNGKREIRYHIEWRGAFGSRATPYLWTSIMGAVLYIVQTREAVWCPLAYMDDAHGPDTSGTLVPFTHEGETRMIPPARAATLRVWNLLLLPWKWKKALFGRVLTVTGIVVDLNALTVYLPPEAVEKFALEVEDFLQFKARNPPLRRWRHIAGWGNWALGVRPLARPLLSPVYAKLGRPDGKAKNASYAGVWINNAVKFALRALVSDLRTGEALSLLDPGLTEWTQDDADIVVYTDACLMCDDKTGSGFGFWFDYQGQRRHYYSRVPYSFQRIPFAEGITVAAAIKEIVNFKFPGIRRVMVRTDSSPVVYAYDAGAAQDTPFCPMRTLLLRSFIDIRKGKFDLRALHVSGKENVLADDLSRLRVALLRRLFGDSLYFFTLPMEYAGGAGAAPKNLSVPIPPRAKLEALRRIAWDSALEPSSTERYQRSLRQWGYFVNAIACHEIPTADTLSLFVVWRHTVEVNAYSTLSGLAYYLRPLMPDGCWDKARFDSVVLRALRGSTKLQAHQKKRAKPMPHSKVVEAILIGLDFNATYEVLLWTTMLVILFYGCGRAAEVTDADRIKYRNPNKHMLRALCERSEIGIKIFLPYQKASPLYAGSYYYFVEADTGPAAFDLIDRFLAVRDHLFGPDGALFRRRNGEVPTRRWFVDRMQAALGKEFTGHSPRPGCATWHVLCGTSDTEIKRLGRWSSASWEDYIRLQPEIAMAMRVRASYKNDPTLKNAKGAFAVARLLRQHGVDV